ncbi:hypothetical protein EDF59_12531 [Novosphingobium sp. ST904]|nr:hypothetical protein EDF59_12531 [Novosphingobium sp. ST904]
MLVHHFHRIGGKARHRAGDEVDDGGDLALGKLAPGLQPHHHRGGGRHVVTHEHGLLALGNVDAHGFHAVDLADGQLQVMLAGGTQALAFQRAAGAHRQLVEHLVAALGRSQCAVGGHEHPRLVEIAFAHGESAGPVVYPVVDPRLVQRRGDTGAVGIAELSVEHALR